MTALRNMFDRLMALAAAAGLSQDAVLQSETSSRLNVEADISASALSGFSNGLLTPMIADWGDDFEFHISSSGIRPFDVTSSQFNPSDLDVLRGDLQALPKATLQVRLTVHKQQFLNRRFPATDAHYVLYVFSRNLYRALQGKLKEVEDIFFPNGVMQCQCFILEHSAELNGRHLSIRHDLQAGSPPKVLKTRYREQIADVQQKRLDNVRWLDFDTSLTPLHFTVEGEAQENDLKSLIGRVQYALIILYLAESARSVTGGSLAIFPGPSRTELLIPRPQPVDPVNNELLIRIFVWCYSERTSDKLDIARNTISSLLGADKSQNYDLLHKNAQRMWNASRSTYLTLVRDLVAKHFDKLKQVQDYVTSISSDLGAKVSNIVSTLIANTLAAIGVVLGAFVAYAFDASNKIKPEVFRFGLFVYGVYILAFPFTYSLLLNNLTDYIILKRDFKRRLEVFEKALGLPSLLTSAGVIVKSRSRHFWVVFSVSACVYVTLTIICFLLWKYLLLPPLT